VKLESLTPRQRDAAEATEPVVFVFGGPGTGKTTAALFAGRLALERPKVEPWQRALFLTFSRAAVG
jgi:superfamily I DNA/RNA helicase